MSKMKMKYLGCYNGIMTWQSDRIPGDSRVLQVTCTWNYFWGGRYAAPNMG